MGCKKRVMFQRSQLLLYEILRNEIQYAQITYQHKILTSININVKFYMTEIFKDS
jgi:hypothetical protein